MGGIGSILKACRLALLHYLEKKDKQKKTTATKTKKKQAKK